MLGRVSEALESAQKAEQGMKASIKRAAEEAEEDLRPLAAMAKAQFDHFALEVGRIVDTRQGSTPERRRGAGRTGTGRDARSTPRSRKPPTSNTGATKTQAIDSKRIRRDA